ncbi:GPR1/FUN34/yaaH family-domain-containing protein [Aspergillus bertholletiae]|uniref:GPR1/FUN34/yaaH family-domain-containing protein n=1 Tax=Aspergillus bertholletiae TaxID=1226010 RepID=A0A5N7BES2_9EURO|nr:GPR1/FUN34/yaaH family-domain-containing protein [Aspergillus bertholletiae]
MSSGDISEKNDIETLRPIQTAESVFLPVTRDVFEKLYLNPKSPWVKGDLRKQVGNPTPISLIGFLVAATPNAFITMGIRGSGGSGGAMLTAFIFFGGVVQLFGAVGEWVIGNTFSCALFFTYGTFWIVQGTGLMPFFATGLQYSSTGNSLEGMETPSYHATLGFYFIALTLITMVYTICSIRTNICLFSALFLLIITFSLFSAVHFQVAAGEIALAERLQMAAGAFNLALCVPVWHIFLAQMLESVDFPYTVPVGDLSTIIRGRSQKMQTDV